MLALVLVAILAGSPSRAPWIAGGTSAPLVVEAPLDGATRVEFAKTSASQSSVVSQEISPGAFTCRQFRAKWISGPTALRWAWTTYGDDGERSTCELRKGEWVWCSACSTPRAKTLQIGPVNSAQAAQSILLDMATVSSKTKDGKPGWIWRWVAPGKTNK
jgi:hypothetical protein